MLAAEQVQSVNTRLDRLLQLAGATGGAELMARLTEDLTRIAQSLAGAMDEDARDVIRRESHILVSISGSIGATDLSEAARRLNLIVHDNAPLPEDLAARITRDLAALRAFLATRLTAGLP